MPIEITIPSVGESITEVQINEWLKAEGDIVGAEETVAVIDSDKTTVDLAAPQGGRLVKILHKAGEKVNVGTVIGHLEPDAKANGKPADKKGPAKPAAAPAEPKKAEAPAKATVAAPKDEKAKPAPAPTPAPEPAAEAPSAEVKIAPKPEAAKPASAPAKPSFASSPSGSREEEIVPMTMLRRAVARNLVEAKQAMAMLTTFNEVDMSAVFALRKQYQEAFEKRYQVKLGLMSFFVKAAIDALKQFPQLNAEIRGTDIVYRNYFDIDVAISTERGLVVPALRNAERLSFAELE